MNSRCSAQSTMSRQDARSYDLFLDAQLAGLARYARALTHDRQDAHDALADCLIKIQANWTTVSRMEKPLAYVRKALMNTVISEHRRWGSRNIQLTTSGALPETAGVDRCAHVDHADEIRRLLSTLTDRQRAMLVMRFYLDLTDSEIAAELDCSAATVRATICRTLGTLRHRPEAELSYA